MKRITVKRIVYHNPNSNEFFIDGNEYDGRLTNENILGAFHERGYTHWDGNQLWIIKDGKYIYRLTVEEFTQYQKQWYDHFLDWVRRI